MSKKKAAKKRKGASAEEPLVVHTAHKRTNALLECLRPDRLTPAHEGGVQRLLSLLGTLPQHAFNSSEAVPHSVMNPSSDHPGEVGVHIFAGSVYLDGFGPLMLTMSGVSHYIVMETLLLSVRKSDTPKGKQRERARSLKSERARERERERARGRREAQQL